MVPHNKMHRGGPMLVDLSSSLHLLHGEHVFTDSATGVDSL